MRPIQWVLATLLFTFSTLSAGQECLRLSDEAAAKLAGAIVSKVRQLEQNVRGSVKRPTLLVKTVELRETDVSDISSTANLDGTTRRKLSEKRCIEAVARSAMSASQRSGQELAFVSPSTEAEVKEWADRVNRLGGNMDPATVSELKARDINYVVVIGGRAAVKSEGCTFRYEYNAEFDVHAIGSREVATQDVPLLSLLPGPPKGKYKYLEVRLDPSQNRISLRALGNAPVCLGRAEVTAMAVVGSNSKTGHPDIGCIPANGTKSLTKSDFAEGLWPRSGYVHIEGGNRCDTWVSDDVSSFPRLFGLGGGDQPPTIVRPCGCWGFIPNGGVFQVDGCPSGYAAAQGGCNQFCAGGTQAYAVVCAE